MAAAALVVIVFASGVRWLIQERTTASYSACINNLRQFDGAIQQWALENKVGSNAVVTWKDIAPYMGRGQANILPSCPQGGTYTISRVGVAPRCSIMSHNLDFGSVVVVDESGVPLVDAQVVVLGKLVELCHVQTSTNGEAYLFDDPRGRGSVATNSWSDGTKLMVVAKQGYHSAPVKLPTCDWPVKFIMKSGEK